MFLAFFFSLFRQSLYFQQAVFSPPFCGMYMCGAEGKRCLKSSCCVVCFHCDVLNQSLLLFTSILCFSWVGFFCLQWTSLFLCNSLFLITVLLGWGWFFFLFHSYKDADVHPGIVEQFFGSDFLSWVACLVEDLMKVCVFFVESSGQNFSRCQCLVRWLVQSLLLRLRKANDLWAGSLPKQWLRKEQLYCGVRLAWSCENELRMVQWWLS